MGKVESLITTHKQLINLSLHEKGPLVLCVCVCVVYTAAVAYLAIYVESLAPQWGSLLVLCYFGVPYGNE